MGGVVLELESDRLIKMGEEIGERRGMKIGERRGVEIGEKRGVEIGEKRGERRGQKAIIEVLRDIGKNKNDASSALMDKFGLSAADANRVVKEFW